jgi:hypothetical protein
MSAGGIIGTILGWLGYQVGQRTDGASSSGSLHSKVGSIQNGVNGLLASPTIANGSAVKSVRRGVVEFNSINDRNINISPPVNPDKCVVLLDNYLTAADSAETWGATVVSLTSTTLTLTPNRYNDGNDTFGKASWQIIEFY